MSEVIEKGALFELELDLPNDKIAASTKRLVGFENRYQRLHRDLRLLADPQELADWSKKFHHKELPICAAVSANWPEYGMISPILTVPCAFAVESVSSAAARPPKPVISLFILSSQAHVPFFHNRSGCKTPGQFCPPGQVNVVRQGGPGARNLWE